MKNPMLLSPETQETLKTLSDIKFLWKKQNKINAKARAMT